MSTEKLSFKAELKQLLHLITHSLYSNREIFLRELISNASDAINRIRFDSLTHEERLEGNKDWKIKLIPNKETGTLTISDNGIGMNRETIVDHLGTIAKSGTRAFLESLQQQEDNLRPDLIGQFGVGFYSAFMVADKVTVVSRMPGSPADGVQWESDGQGDFTVEQIEKPARGTDVILHLKEDAKEFLSPWTLGSLVKKYSDFVEHPVVMDVERKEGDETKVEEETLNAQTALWLRNKSESNRRNTTPFISKSATTPKSRPESFTTPPRARPSSESSLSFRRTSQSHLTGRNRKGSSSISSACSSWIRAKGFCRRTFDSSAAWSIRPTYR